VEDNTIYFYIILIIYISNIGIIENKCPGPEGPVSQIRKEKIMHRVHYTDCLLYVIYQYAKVMNGKFMKP